MSYAHLKKFLLGNFVFFITILEISNIFEMSFVTAGFIGTFITVASILITKIWGKRKSAAVNQRSLSDESLVSLHLRKHLVFLKGISLKISEDKEKLLSEGHSTFQEDILKELECIEPSDQETIYSSLEEKYFSQNQQIKDIFKTLEALQCDFLTLKSQLQQVSPILMKIFKNEFLEPSNTATSPIEITRSDEDCQQLHEVSSLDLTTSIQSVTKESFEKLVSENRMRGKEIVQNISRFYEKSQKDIQKEVIIFSSVTTGKEHDEQNSADFSLIAEVENIEKKLLEMFIFLNRQRFDMDNLKKTLTSFTKKFVYVAAKFDAYWQQSKASYSSAAQRLKDSEILMSSATEKMNINTESFLQKTTDLANITENIIKILAMRESNFDFSTLSNVSDGNVSEALYEPDSLLTQNIDHVNQKLHELMVISENSSGRVNSLNLVTKNLEALRNMTEGYETLLSFLLSSVEQSKVNQLLSKPFQKSDRSVTSNEIRIVAKDDPAECNESLWNEVANELHSKLPNLDVRNVISILKDNVETTWDLVGYEKTTFGDETGSADFVKNNDYNIIHIWTDFSG